MHSKGLRLFGSGKIASDLSVKIFGPENGLLLGLFRIFFGFLLAYHIFEQNYSGVVQAIYIEPRVLFKMPGFLWLPRPTLPMTFFLQGLLFVTAFFIAIGYLFRGAVISFFLVFLYFFLLEITYYNNHYYLVLLVLVLLGMTSAGKVFSLDAFFAISRDQRKEMIPIPEVPAWNYWALRFQMGLVYFYGGIAKINTDWLSGKPMDAWLQGTWLRRYPIEMSWGGFLFDLLIFPALLFSRTRVPALILALLFHFINSFLFPIGVFPAMAMALTLLFLDPLTVYKRISAFNILQSKFLVPVRKDFVEKKSVLLILGVWFAIQILMPLRHFLHNRDINWSTDHERFSWRMKLNSRETEGVILAFYKGSGEVLPLEQDLTAFQWRIVKSNPDALNQYAVWKREALAQFGKEPTRIGADVRLSLNGRPYSQFIDVDADVSQPLSLWEPYPWVLPSPRTAVK